MLVSTKGRYGLRMMIDIARNQENGKVTLRSIGERQGISIKYLEQLARALCTADLLSGCRGQGGGYTLARSADQITAGDILRAVEGSTAPVYCLVHERETCKRRDMCETNKFWLGLEEAIDVYVNSVSLSDLVRDCSDRPTLPGPCLGVSSGV